MRESVVVIGVFDGVHAGHRALVAAARGIAGSRHLVALSFDPHPASVLRPETFHGLLTLPDHRADLLRAAGVDRVDYLAFDESLRALGPDEFIESQVIEPYGAAAVVVGRNFRFGHKAAGDEETLRALAAKYGFEAHVVDLVGDARAFSSTRVREALLAGQVRAAATMLGRPHRLVGTVVHGDERGRQMGYPTANLDVTAPLLVPGDGVYSALVTHDGKTHPAAVSIGTNPTFEGVVGRRVEAHVLDRDDLALYGEHLTVDFIDYVRPMVKFDTLEALLDAMAVDVATARGHLADLG